MHRRPTIRAWTREEDGSYQAEIQGFRLHLRWKSGNVAGERGFTWTATREELKLESAELEEEVEIAMGLAEAAIEPHVIPAA